MERAEVFGTAVEESRQEETESKENIAVGTYR